MRFAAALVIGSLVCPFSAFAADNSLTRAEGFELIWKSTSRPVESTRETPYADVKKGSTGYDVITYAKARGLLDDSVEKFYPDSPIAPSDALRWIFRTRSVEPIDASGDRILSKLPEPEQVPALAEHYGISYDTEASSMTKEELLALMRTVDAKLMAEVHEVSLYSEKFHGKGTAFGEAFDMYALTAAHRTFPGNTLVKVTNVENGKSVVVRINDRGPYVQGRDMDLSLGSFTTIAERSKGKIQATFERLGDANVVGGCDDPRMQQRITKDVQLNPGVPHFFTLGRTLAFSSDQSFVVHNVIYPDGTETGTQTWVTKGESFDMTPSTPGLYRFIMGTKEGRRREMRMQVVDCGAS